MNRRRNTGLCTIPLARGACLVLLAHLLPACESDPPDEPDVTQDDGTVLDDGGDTEAADADADSDADADADADVLPPCGPLTTDYQPRTGLDDWPACVSDDNTYHPIDPSIGSVARIASFELLADRLWRNPVPPTAADFTNARVIYVDTNGLDSRVQRREDLHYPAVPAADGACTDAGVPALYPDRCVGPARILPILNQAFVDGSAGTEPVINAARIEAALLWFLYLSPYKEAHTCTDTPRDCDSSWAYYTGGEGRSAGLGMASYVRSLDEETHDRSWDGFLAVRCWKNLDNETGVSTDLVLRDRAIAQLDRAMLRGVAVIVRDRFDRLAADTTGEARRADWQFLQILGAMLDREAAIRDPPAAAILRAELAGSDPIATDIPAAQAALDTLFPCP